MGELILHKFHHCPKQIRISMKLQRNPYDNNLKVTQQIYMSRAATVAKEKSFRQNDLKPAARLLANAEEEDSLSLFLSPPRHPKNSSRTRTRKTRIWLRGFGQRVFCGLVIVVLPMALCATGMRPVSTNLSGIGSSRPLSLPSSRNFFDSLSPTRDCLKSASRFASLQQQQLTCWKLRDVTAVDTFPVSGSYRAAQGNETSSTAANDLLVVGAGVLGSLIGTNWLQQKQHERCKVVGQTNTCNRHEELRTLGIVPVTRNQQDGDDKFPFVVFSAPPSGSEDYVAEIRYVATKVEPCVQQVCGCSGTHGSLCFEMSYSEVACFVLKLHLHCWEVST
jgi:hypothetical protein